MKQTDKLFEAILLLRTKDECYNFFEDIGTIAEIKAFQRLEVAKMLNEGKHTARSTKTGATKLQSAGLTAALITVPMAIA